MKPEFVPDEKLPTIHGSSKLVRLARIARAGVREGMDPELALSFVIWPTDRLERLAA